MTTAMFSSKTDEWETPQWLFDKLNAVYEFDLDVCATKQTAKCKQYFTKEDNGLRQPWLAPNCWMNPPYGREIGKWVKKAYIESIVRKTTVVCLLPARTDTSWFHDYVLQGQFLHFIRGRLKFGDSKNSAPSPSMVCVFGNNMPMAHVDWRTHNE